MKKILCALVALMLMSSVGFAQAKSGAKDVKKGKTENAPKDDNKATAPSGKLKKDGTPDMRYKANKDAKAPAKPMAK